MNSLIKSSRNGINRSRNSFNTFPTLSSWFDGMLSTDFMPNFNTGMTLPAVNIKEDDNEFLVEMAVPGMKKSDFNIDLDNELLSISVEASTKNEEEASGYTRREFGYSSFKRSFNVPETVDGEKIEAKYNEGILTIHLPKREEAKKKPVRTIKIS